MSLSYKRGLTVPMAQAASKLGLLDAYGSLRRRLVSPAAGILMYHRVNGCHGLHNTLPATAKQDFEEQIKYLRRRYKIVSLNELSNVLSRGETITARTVAITFDDGYRDNYLNAYPILKKYNVPATIFLVTGHIGSDNLFWWDKVSYVVHNTVLETLKLDGLGIYPLKTSSQRSLAASIIPERLKELPDSEKNSVIERLVRISGVEIPSGLGKELILSWDEIREMAKNGIFFGCHTVNHPVLTRLPLEEAQREIVESKRSIEEKLDRPAITFSYPNGKPGDFNESIKKILEEGGFTCAVTAAPPKLINSGADPYELGRIPPGWNASTMQLCVSGLYPDLKNVWGRVIR